MAIFLLSKLGLQLKPYLNIEKYYVYKIFTILSYQILSGRLLLVVIGGQKINLNFGFKLKPIITCHI